MRTYTLTRQTLVYWGSPSPDGFGGFTYGAPVEIKCKWTDRKEKFIGKTGDLGTYRELISDAVLLLASDIEVGGQVALTTLDQLSSSQLPADNDAYEVKGFRKTPDVNAVNYVRKAWV